MDVKVVLGICFEFVSVFSVTFFCIFLSRKTIQSHYHI